tara:strand:+ start:159558 stop:160430 length:873 start_codon:yes stop_codon:yes gene_type:complete
MSNKITNDNLSLVLKNGRRVGFAEYGDSTGKPVFFFHGVGGGSRLDARYLHQAALLNHVRLISMDRPGIGLSSNSKKQTILSWVDDFEAFADALSIQKFSIVGHSGGAACVAACAYKIPHRLISLSIVSGLAPFEKTLPQLSRGQRILHKVIHYLPWVATLMMKMTSMMFKRPKMLKKALKQMPSVDQLALQAQGTHDALSLALMESFKQGVAGASWELQRAMKPWGFELSQIKVKCPINIWQGGLDKQVPAIHADVFATLIPQAQSHFFENEGHLSLLINQGEQILADV